MNVGLLLAGGEGRRFSSDVPKQFSVISDRPLLLYAMDAFIQSAKIDAVSIVCMPGRMMYLEGILQSFDMKEKVVSIIEGGEDRFHSIYNGVHFFRERLGFNDWIVIHDAVRPFVTVEMIEDSLAVAQNHGASLAVAACYDTMYLSDDGESVKGVYPREHIYKGQTPETIRYDIALKCYSHSLRDGTFYDPPSNLLMKMNQHVGLSKGSQNNIKITTNEDVIAFQTIMARRLKTRE